MSRAALAEKERECRALEQQRTSAQEEVEKLREQRATLRATQSHGHLSLNEERARAQQRREALRVTQGELEESRREREALQTKLADEQNALDRERNTLEAAAQSRQRIEEARVALEAVRAEVRALAAPATRKAALAAGGGDLLEPAVVPQLPRADERCGDPAKFWTTVRGTTGGFAEELGTPDPDACIVADGGCESGAAPVAVASGPEDWDGLRRMLQSEAVVVTLQRSLVARAAELREGLRQWAFARRATADAEELCQGLRSSEAEHVAERQQASTERDEAVMEQQASAATLSSLRRGHADHSKRSDDSERQLLLANSEFSRLQASRTSLSLQLNEKKRALTKLRSEHDEAALVLASQQASNDNFEQEASRRAGAAQRLALKGQAQAERSAQELEQARRELSSVKQAHALLREAHGAIGNETELERRKHLRLVAEHAALKADLEALANHYLALLPAFLPSELQEEAPPLHTKGADNPAHVPASPALPLPLEGAGALRPAVVAGGAG